MNPPLRVRLDEAAAAVNKVIPAKLLLNLFGALMGLLMMSWQASVAWLLGGMILEAWGWMATRRQAKGGFVGKTARWNFAANFVAVNAWWAVLGLLFWNTGLLEGHICAIILWVSLATMLVPLFYSTPWVFLLAGALPSVAAMCVFAVNDAQPVERLAPIFMALGLSFIFALGRALETPSAQAAERALNDSLTQYKMLTDTVTDVICRTDLDLSLIHI